MIKIFIIIFAIIIILSVIAAVLIALHTKSKVEIKELPWCCLLDGESCKNPDMDCIDCEVFHKHRFERE